MQQMIAHIKLNLTNEIKHKSPHITSIEYELNQNNFASSALIELVTLYSKTQLLLLFSSVLFHHLSPTI